MSHKRILIKLSGELLLGSKPFGIDAEAVLDLAKNLGEIIQNGYELGIVLGGGNLFRGISLEALGIARTPADQIGMLATMMNGIALSQAFQGLGIDSRLMSALDCPKIAESYNWQKANDYLSKKHPIIFTGGTGNPYFTTDTAAALRAAEINASLLLKATKVAGVYSSDPKKNQDAKKYSTISYAQYLNENLSVMDATSIALCRNSKIPIFVFSMHDLGKIPIESLLVNSEKYGTIIGNC